MPADNKKVSSAWNEVKWRKLWARLCLVIIFIVERRIMRRRHFTFASAHSDSRNCIWCLDKSRKSNKVTSNCISFATIIIIIVADIKMNNILQVILYYIFFFSIPFCFSWFAASECLFSFDTCIWCFLRLVQLDVRSALVKRAM